MNDQQNRLDTLLAYLEQDPDNWTLLTDATELSLQQGAWEHAAWLTERAQQLRPQDAGMRYRRAVVLRATGQGEAALPLTGRLLEEERREPAILFEHALNLVHLERFPEAEPFLQQLTGLETQDIDGSECVYLYIHTLHCLGKLDLAREVALAYVETHPADARVTGLMSLLCLDSNDITAAEKYAKASLALDAQQSNALLTTGYVDLARAQAEPAQTVFEELVLKKQDSGRAWMGLGLAFLYQAQLAEARLAFEKTIRLLPKHPGCRNTLAWIQILQKDHGAARQTLQAALALERNFGETHGGLAVLAACENDWGNATHSMELALRLQPASFAGRLAKSLILEHQSQPQQAEAMLQSLLLNVTAAGPLRLKQLADALFDRH